jgi:signal transduction histidine kinase
MLMKNKSIPLAQIVKGRPIFRRHLYISSALFVAIILVTTLILIQLALDAIKDRVSSEMSRIAELNAQKISERIQPTKRRTSAIDGTAELQDDYEVKAYVDGLIADQEEILYIFVQNLRGDILLTSMRRGVELEQNNFSKILLSPANPRPQKIRMVSLVNPKNEYFDLIEQRLLNEQTQLIFHFGIDNSVMEKRYVEYRSVILKRIVLAASAVVAILSLALLYILWLLRRAQVIEAEAHMADRLAYLGTLASGLAHEIRNPLSAINLNLQMLEEDLDPNNGKTSELADLLKGTKQEIKRLERLASNFLFYARPVGMERQETTIAELLDDVVRLVSKECERLGIRLSLEKGPEFTVVKVDRDLMKQAILNLIVNAQEAVASKAEGDRHICVQASVDNHEVVIQVRDNGPGIRLEDSKSLFKLFHSSKRGGTGLGLPISQRIVEAHGGKIEWKNLEQGGAEFTIRIQQ